MADFAMVVARTETWEQTDLLDNTRRRVTVEYSSSDTVLVAGDLLRVMLVELGWTKVEAESG